MERGRRGIAESLVFAKAKMRHYIYYYILAHELTHVSQNKNKEEYRSVSKKIMEQEAVLEESLEMYDPEPYEDYEVDGIKYRLRKNQIAKVEYMAEKKKVRNVVGY